MTDRLKATVFNSVGVLIIASHLLGRSAMLGENILSVFICLLFIYLCLFTFDVAGNQTLGFASAREMLCQ